jgi:hypothetical protein
MDPLDKLTAKLADWLLYNHAEIEKAILSSEYQGSTTWEKDYVRYRSALDSFVERFITSQDYHLNIVLTVKSAIYLLNLEYFELYLYRYDEHKQIDQIANLLSVNEKTVRRKIQEIREHTWKELLSEGIMLENVARLRERYYYIPTQEGKNHVSKRAKNQGDL